MQVTALHVHHGLRAEADGWLRQVQAQCRRWGAGFMSRRLQAAPARGESVEAWARRERYLALAEMARQSGCGLVLLAHHRRDQAETWLLQALRSAGPAGLAAMPLEAERVGLAWARPWLAHPRTAIEAYVRRHRLRFVDDASNADPRFARNRLRAAVWPALVQAFADAETTLAGAALRAQEAAALAAEVAAADLPLLRRGAALEPGALAGAGPGAAPQRAARLAGAALPAAAPESLVRATVPRTARRARRALAGAGGELRLHRGLLTVHRASPPAAQRPPDPRAISTAPGEWPVPPWRGRFVVAGRWRAVSARGAARRRRADSPGGERFRLAQNATARSLKKQFQASGRAAWERGGPLLYTAAGGCCSCPDWASRPRRRALPGAAAAHRGLGARRRRPTGPRQADG